MTLVRYEAHDSVAVITVDNPPVNALSPGVPGGIIAGLNQANTDSDIVAVVLVGEGRGFIAGADIRYFSKPWPKDEPRLGDVIRAFEQSSKPVVAAIHGSNVLVEFGPRTQGSCPKLQFEILNEKSKAIRDVKWVPFNLKFN